MQKLRLSRTGVTLVLLGAILVGCATQPVRSTETQSKPTEAHPNLASASTAPANQSASVRIPKSSLMVPIPSYESSGLPSDGLAVLSDGTLIRCHLLNKEIRAIDRENSESISLAGTDIILILGDVSSKRISTSNHSPRYAKVNGNLEFEVEGEKGVSVSPDNVVYYSRGIDPTSVIKSPVSSVTFEESPVANSADTVEHGSVVPGKPYNGKVSVDALCSFWDGRYLEISLPKPVTLTKTTEQFDVSVKNLTNTSQPINFGHSFHAKDPRSGVETGMRTVSAHSSKPVTIGPGQTKVVSATLPFNSQSRVSGKGTCTVYLLGDKGGIISNLISVSLDIP